MTTRTRFWVLLVSTPVMAFALVGGYLGQVMAKDGTFQHLRVFEDVVSLVVNNYVEEVDIRQAMQGALKGLAEGLDPDSAYLTPELVRAHEANLPAGPAEVGLVLIRQYYLRVVSVREGSPAAKAGLRTGDFIRGIDDKPTRGMSTYEGSRMLQGAPNSQVKLLVFRGNAAEPHDVVLTRERQTGADVVNRVINPTTGYVHVLEFAKDTATRVKSAIDTMAKGGATQFVIDIRGTAKGDLDDGIAAARLFVKTGTLAVRSGKGQQETVAATDADGGITVPVVLLVGQGTSGAAEVFAAALDGNNRAELVGEHTLGRVARQRLVKLPDGSGLLISTQRYLTPKSAPLHERGLVPDLAVEEPDVEFGTAPPPGDKALDAALARLAKPGAAAKPAA